MKCWREKKSASSGFSWMSMLRFIVRVWWDFVKNTGSTTSWSIHLQATWEQIACKSFIAKASMANFFPQQSYWRFEHIVFYLVVGLRLQKDSTLWTTFNWDSCCHFRCCCITVMLEQSPQACCHCNEECFAKARRTCKCLQLATCFDWIVDNFSDARCHVDISHGVMFHLRSQLDPPNDWEVCLVLGQDELPSLQQFSSSLTFKPGVILAARAWLVTSETWHWNWSCQHLCWVCQKDMPPMLTKTWKRFQPATTAQKQFVWSFGPCSWNSTLHKHSGLAPQQETATVVVTVGQDLESWIVRFHTLVKRGIETCLLDFWLEQNEKKGKNDHNFLTMWKEQHVGFRSDLIACQNQNASLNLGSLHRLYVLELKVTAWTFCGFDLNQMQEKLRTGSPNASSDVTMRGHKSWSQWQWHHWLFQQQAQTQRLQSGTGVWICASNGKKMQIQDNKTSLTSRAWKFEDQRSTRATKQLTVAKQMWGLSQSKTEFSASFCFQLILILNIIRPVNFLHSCCRCCDMKWRQLLVDRPLTGLADWLATVFVNHLTSPTSTFFKGTRRGLSRNKKTGFASCPKFARPVSIPACAPPVLF